MNDAATSADARCADQARADLLADIRQIKKVGSRMIEKTETSLQQAPLLLGLGVAGLALVGVAVLARRRHRPLFAGLARERSFLAEAVRSAALSALGILSGRITQRLLAAALDTKELAHEQG